MDNDVARQFESIQKQLRMLQSDVASLREAVEGRDLSAVIHSLDSKVTRMLEYLEHSTPPFD